MNAPHAYFKALCGTFNILLIYRYHPNKNNGLNRLKMAHIKEGATNVTPPTYKQKPKQRTYILIFWMSLKYSS